MDFSSFSFIFIGDTHGYSDDFQKQKEIIELVSPDYVLSEQLQDILLESSADFLSLLNKRNISSLVSFAEIEQLIHLCFQKEIKLIGIDLHDFGFDSSLQKVIKEKKVPTEEENARIIQLVEKRQQNHLIQAKKYLTLTKKPIIVLVGAWHLQETSPLMKELSNYCVFFPCNEEGSLLVKPPQQKRKVQYGMRIKKQ